MTNLACCPWCNGAAHIKAVARDWWKIVIDHDDDCMLSGFVDDVIVPQDDESKALLIKRWNARRVQASAEPCAWEVRRLDPVEGPSIWLHAHRVDIEGYRRRPELYELRPLYAAPQQSQSDYMLQLLVAAGHVTMAKVDETRAIANDLGISAGKEKTNG